MAASGRSAPLVRYGLAVAAVLLALLLTVLLQPLLDSGVFLLFFGVVIVLVWYGSVGTSPPYYWPVRRRVLVFFDPSCWRGGHRAVRGSRRTPRLCVGQSPRLYGGRFPEAE
jgi:hypothetical protein